MNVTLQPGSIAEIDTPLAIVGVFADQDLPYGLGDLIEKDDFGGTFRQTLLVPFIPSTPITVVSGTSGNTGGQNKALAARRVLLLGLGKQDEATPERLRRAYAEALNKAKELKITTAAIQVPTVEGTDQSAVLRAVADGVLLASYKFDQFKGTASNKDGDKKPPIETVTLVGEGEQAIIEQAQSVYRGVKLARDLGNEPSAVCTPTRFAEVAEEIAQRGGMQLTVLDRPQMEELGMGGMLGVSQGTHEPPKFIVLEYGQKGNGKTLALVGKGITFDTGGISIKPAEKMDMMKMDMMGAAAVLGTMSALADLKPANVHVVGIVASTENMPGGHAFKPGDILKAMNGVTMEILNTDAEGRLVLADGLSYAQRYEPDAIVDLATLTGAMVVALGNHIAGAVTNNDEWAARVKQAGDTTGELVWQMPLLPEYREAVKSKIADIKNTAGRAAGGITAGAFLENFVDGRPWVHLDIAGVAWAEDQPTPYNVNGASGWGVRLLTELVQRYAA
jgi:leucyl aminopeptidase